MNERHRNPASPVYDRALLLHGSKRNEMLTLSEIEQYGLDSFADADYISIYGMPPNLLSELPDGQGWQRDYLPIRRKDSGLTSIFTLRIG